MTKFLEGLRSGLWLTPSRMQAWAGLFLIGCIVAALWLAGTAHGVMDAFGRPLGTDFSCFYAAGALGLKGQAVQAYQLVPLQQEMTSLFGDGAPYYGWYYPPVFLLVMSALATLPYIPALLIWQGGTLLLYLLAMAALARRFLTPQIRARRLFWLLVLAFPVVSLNIGYGQNGLLSAALMALGCAWLRARPLCAGLCFGLMCYKPQLALLIPFVLAIGGCWRAVFGACLTGALTLLVPTALWGMQIWPAFFYGLHVAQTLLLNVGGVGFSKSESLFAALRHLGVTLDMAYALHSLLALMIIALTFQIWRRRQDSVRLIALLLASLLISPHIMNYDLMLLAPVCLLMTAGGLQHGFAPWEKSLIAALWLVPAASATIAETSYIPAGLIVLLLAFFLLFRKVRGMEMGKNANLPV